MLDPALLVYLVPIVFAVTGGVMAANRGRNFLFWGVCSAFFPICIMIVWFEKPIKELKGHFRKCCSCGEWIKWKEISCRYCGTTQ
jgi:hypothetical protein